MDRYELPRRRMIKDLMSRCGIYTKSVLDVMGRVPRHLFVSEALRYRAYNDVSLPIGFGQTISKPSTVARMVQAMDLTGNEKVLEIGTGSGYQSAVMAQLSDRLISAERIEELYKRSRENLLIRLNYRNITLMNNDNFMEIEGCFDIIIVAAGAQELPSGMIDRLNDGGVLIIPVGIGEKHIIKKYRKIGDSIIEDDLGEASFVPLVNN